MNFRTAIFSLLLLSNATFLSAQSSKPHLNHVAIFVTDLQVSRTFYENIIGLDSIPEPFHDGKHKWYNLGPGLSLHVIQGADKKKEYFRNQHTCLSVGSVENFSKILLKHKIEFEDLKGDKNKISNRVDGVKQIWLRDPDGYWLEINDAKD